MATEHSLPLRGPEERSSLGGQPSPVAWPVVSGKYVVGNPDRSVAVCTLASSDLVDQIGARDEIAIVGRLYTMNLGLEKLVWNIVANPAVRFLVLCGDDTSSQISQGIVNLHTRGMDDDHRIRGVQGYQPFVHNLTAEELAAFQQQVEIVPLIGETDIETILATARQLEARTPGRWGPGVIHPFPQPLTATRNRMGDIRLDPRGLFLVGIRRASSEIIVEHYSADRRYLGAVVGTEAEAICHTLVREGLIAELSHAAYIGREVSKAEEALRWGLEYEQDRPLFPSGQGGRWAPFGPRANRTPAAAPAAAPAPWDPAAADEFARRMDRMGADAERREAARRRAEALARELGLAEVTVAVLDELRARSMRAQ